MRLRQSALLTPSQSTLPGCLSSYKHFSRVSPLVATLADRSQVVERTATLSSLESALTAIASISPLEATLAKKQGEGGMVNLPPHQCGLRKPQPCQDCLQLHAGRIVIMVRPRRLKAAKNAK